MSARIVTEGNQSPAIDSGGGEVKVVYGISEEHYQILLRDLDGKERLVRRLLSDLDDKDEFIASKEKAIEAWIKKFRELESRLDSAHVVEKEVARKYLVEGDLEKAEEVLSNLLESQKANLVSQQKLIAGSYYDLSKLKALKLEYNASLGELHEAVRLDELNVLYLLELGNTYRILGRYKESIPHFEKALYICNEHCDPSHLYIADCKTNLGIALSNSGERAQAIALQEEALEIYRLHYGSDHSTVSLAINNLAASLDQNNEKARAIALCEEALQIEERLGRASSDCSAALLSNIGLAYSDLEDFERAIVFLLKAEKIYVEKYGDNSLEAARCYAHLGKVYCLKNEIEKSIGYCVRSNSFYGEVFGEDHPGLADNYYYLGEDFLKSDDLVRAKEFFENAIKITRKFNGEDHSSVAKFSIGLSSVARKMADFGAARESLENVLRIQLLNYGDSHTYLIQTYNNLAFICSNLGLTFEAYTCAKKALEVCQNNDEATEKDWNISRVNYQIHSAKYGASQA